MKPHNKYQESNQGFLGIIKTIFYELSYRILGVSLRETRFEVYDQFFKNSSHFRGTPDSKNTWRSPIYKMDWASGSKTMICKTYHGKACFYWNPPVDLNYSIKIYT